MLAHSPAIGGPRFCLGALMAGGERVRECLDGHLVRVRETANLRSLSGTPAMLPAPTYGASPFASRWVFSEAMRLAVPGHGFSNE